MFWIGTLHRSSVVAGIRPDLVGRADREPLREAVHEMGPFRGVEETDELVGGRRRLTAMPTSMLRHSEQMRTSGRKASTSRTAAAKVDGC